MFRTRIVVTGMGAVTPVGHDVAELWQSLLAARSGVAPVRGFPIGEFRPAYASEVKDFAPERAGLPRKKLKVMGRHAQLAYVAAHQACSDAGLTGDTAIADRSRFGIILGVGMLNADVTELGRAFYATAHASQGEPHEDAGEPESFDVVAFGRHGGPELFPLWLLRHIPNLSAAHSAIALDARGPSNTITTGCVSAANAIGEAARLIARGDADVMLAGGADARVSPLAMLRYRALGWLATRDDVEPAAVSAPFDEDAAGFVNGEAAGVLVLESLEHARARGARVYAELAGYGAANDAHELLAPHPAGRGLERAAIRCMDRGGLRAADIDAVFSPAAGVPAFDRAIASALTSACGACPTGPPVTATRSIVGHTHAASAAVDCVAAIKAIDDSQVPPTLNLHRPIADLAFVTGGPRVGEISTALVSAYGFGGHAAVLAWQRCSG